LRPSFLQVLKRNGSDNGLKGNWTLKLAIWETPLSNFLLSTDHFANEFFPIRIITLTSPLTKAALTLDIPGVIGIIFWWSEWELGIDGR